MVPTKNKFVPDEGQLVRVVGRVRCRKHLKNCVKVVETNEFYNRLFKVAYYYPVYDGSMMVALYQDNETGFELILDEKEFSKTGVFNYLEAVEWDG